MDLASPLKAIDLFCGAGGLSLGLTRAGFEVVVAADKWGPAAASYRLNFPDHVLVETDLGELRPQELLDAAGIEPGEVDLVAGGPPCQGFSIQRIGSDADARNSLVLKFGEIVAKVRPKMFLMENVPGLLGKRGHELAEAFRAAMVAAGYDVRSEIVDAADYGVPQHRRRVVFFGWRRDDVRPFETPAPVVAPSEYRTVKEAISDLPRVPADCSPHPLDELHRRMRISALNQERLKHIPPGGGFEDLPVELRVDCHKAGAALIGHRYVYGRLHPDEPAATITARFDSFTRGKFAHPSEDRNISLREGARLQSFPDEHRFVGTQEEIAALIGNAVPPLLGEHLAAAIARHLSVVAPAARAQRRAAHPQLSLFDSAGEGTFASDG